MRGGGITVEYGRRRLHATNAYDTESNIKQRELLIRGQRPQQRESTLQKRRIKRGIPVCPVHAWRWITVVNSTVIERESVRETG
jgi:hypothetical protein